MPAAAIVADVLGAGDAAEQERRLRSWAAEVRAAGEPHHGRVRSWAAGGNVKLMKMTRHQASGQLTSLALAAVLIAAGVPPAAACPGMIACPMAAAVVPSPGPCHGEASMLGHEPPRRLAAEGCCVQAPPVLPVAISELRATLAPEAPAPAGAAVHPAGALAAPRFAVPIDDAPPIHACERLSLLQTFLI